MRNKIVFYLNGKRKEVGSDKAGMMLAEYLRYEENLTGTKIVCAEGDCGACSVLRFFPHIENGTDTDKFIPINSCISMLALMDGSSLITVDALKKDDTLHETQRAMVSCHGSQCGFCTPGFVIALTGLVEEKLCRKEVTLTPQEAKNCMTGNLCRCTGYQPIINAALDIDLSKCESLKERYFSRAQEEDLVDVCSLGVAIDTPKFSFFAPKTLKEAIQFLKANPDTRIIGSATDLGVIHNKRKLRLFKLLSLHLINELYEIQATNNVLSFGARVTLAEFRHFIKDKVPDLANYIDVFASPQIKNIGTLVGNVANASPIGDTPPALLALNAKVEVHGPNGTREIPLKDFFISYRKTALQEAEIISAVKFSLPAVNSTLRFFKNANRKDLDISGVNMAIRVDWKDKEKTQIADIVIAAGGIAAIPLRLKKTETFLKANPLNQTTLDRAVIELHSEFNPLSDLRASSAYRRVLIENFFKRFFAENAGAL